MGDVASSNAVEHWQNPFLPRPGCVPPQAYGRRDLLKQMVRRLTAGDPASLNLVGPRRIGKTTILRDLGAPAGCLHRAPFNAVIGPGLAPECLLPIYQDLAGCPPGNPFADLAEVVLTALERRGDCDLRGLDHEIQLDKTAAQLARAGTQMRLTALARAAQAHGLRLILCLDRVDEARLLADAGSTQYVTELTQYASLVLATRRPLVDIFPALVGSPLLYRLERLDVGLLEPETAAEALVAPGAELQFSPPDQALLLELVGRHPYILMRAAATAYEHLRTTAGQPLTRNFIWQTVNSALEVIFQYLWNGWECELRQFVAVYRNPQTAWEQLVGDTFIRTLQDEAIIAEDMARPDRLEFFSPLFAAFASRRAAEPAVPASVLPPVAPAAPHAVLAEMGLGLHTRSGQLFLALYQRLGQLVPDADLARPIWGDQEPGVVKHALEIAAAGLRKKLHAARLPYRLVRKYGQGYRLEYGEPPLDGDA